MKVPKLSIIIPVYNGEKYISRCLDSVFSLPLSAEELEVIVVDDCSTDTTLDILRGYQIQRPNLIVLHQERNQRQGAARNRGIEIAKGEYIAFADADDEVVAEGYMNALTAVAISHVDICYFELEFTNQHTNGWTLCEMPQETRNTIMSSKEYLNRYYTCYYNGSVRNFYRTEFLRGTGIRFVEGVRWEDCDWTVKVYSKAKEIQFVDGVGYRYAQNDTNTCSQSKTALAMYEQLYAGLRLLQFADEIQNKLAGLAKTITDEARYKYVIEQIRLRNLTKYSAKYMRKVYRLLGKGKREALSSYKWPWWENIVLTHQYVTLSILSVLCPLAYLGRWIMAVKRKL